MSEKPILFSGPMVQAILDGRKTQTRRVVKGAPSEIFGYKFSRVVLGTGIWTTEGHRGGLYADGGHMEVRCPYGKVGDRLWVREAHSIQPCNCCVRYRADEDLLDAGEKWAPSIHMSRRFSRITLEITDVRVERLQDISEEDAQAEGMQSIGVPILNTQDGSHLGDQPSFRYGFMALWNKINGKKYPWASNPWVWVIEFKRI